jgi:hypothetical protein
MHEATAEAALHGHPALPASETTADLSFAGRFGHRVNGAGRLG